MSAVQHGLEQVRRVFDRSRWAIGHGEKTRFDSALNGPEAMGNKSRDRAREGMR